MTTLRLTFDQLLHHEQFVRQTLRGLLRDDALVDDAVQETWLRAWRRPPAALQEPQAWLARTARNLAIGRWRSERRRAGREQAVATGAAHVESAEASQRRVEMCQQVVAAILALDEPYRGVVLLRYEQGLEPVAIARQLGRSAATVRSQLSRAHDLLRERLDREFGGRERWGAMAVAFVGPASGNVATFGGALVVAGVAAVGLAMMAWLVWPAPPPESLGTGTPSRATVATAAPAIAATPPDQRIAELRREAAAPPQDPQAANALRSAATLFDRTWYEDYELATFSFEHGLRDDPGLRVTHNDWELMFDRGEFHVRMVGDDLGLIADLGPLEPAAFGAAVLPTLLPIQTTRVHAGHAYYIGTRDSDTTLATVLFVRACEAHRTCTFDWFTTDGTGRWQGSVADPGKGRAWVDVLADLFRQQLAAQNLRPLAAPDAVLQLRGGAGGGNPRRLDLAGDINGYVDDKQDQPLDLTTPPGDRDRCLAWSRGGTVPTGSVFVITRIDYRGGNPGDSNGPGGFRVVVNGHAVVDLAPSKQPIAGAWTGRLVVANGAERDTFFEIRNSSWGEVRLTGVFEAGAARPGFGGANAGFGKVTVADATPAARLGVPEVRLQLRTGAVGGNGCRLDLRTRQTLRIDRLAAEPLDFTVPLAADEHCVGFGTGGVLPAGCTFVVTSVRYRYRTGDGKGQPLRIVVAGKEIATSSAAGTDSHGEQGGAFSIPAGEETRTYVEIANDSEVELVLSGRFEYR